MSNYEALVKVLLHSAKHSEPESFVQRIGIYLLNSLACQVEGREKRLLGKLGCVKTMLELVEYRVQAGIFDDVLEVAWSTMWNMTDETSVNCQRFLDEKGMALFLMCVEVRFFTVRYITYLIRCPRSHNSIRIFTSSPTAIPTQRGAIEKYDGFARQRGGSRIPSDPSHAGAIRNCVCQPIALQQRRNRGFVSASLFFFALLNPRFACLIEFYRTRLFTSETLLHLT